MSKKVKKIFGKIRSRIVNIFSSKYSKLPQTTSNNCKYSPHNSSFDLVVKVIVIKTVIEF